MRLKQNEEYHLLGDMIGIDGHNHINIKRMMYIIIFK